MIKKFKDLQRMAIGIISAMQEEMQTLLNNLQDQVVTTKGMRTYYKGKLFNVNVILVFSRWGKVASATTTTQLINDFDVDEIVFTGVAGALSEELNIGDIIIGKNLYQHDIDASPLFKKFEVPLLHKTYFETSDKHRDRLYQSSLTFLNSYDSYVDINQANTFQINQPRVLIGDIASGDQFISDIRSVQNLSKQLPTVKCVEMEGAAVAQVCYEYKIPFSIIRIISDKANGNSHIDFPKFASEVASHYALGIFENYL